MCRPVPPDIAPGPVFVITGVSAAGKSSVGDALARELGRAVHVRGDLFRRMVVAGREEITPDPSPGALDQLRLRYELGVLVAGRYAAAGFAVVLQDIYFSDLGWMVESFAGIVADRYVVVLDPSAEVVAAREARRPKTAYRAGNHTIDDLRRALHTETPRLGLWLDTSDLSLDETVATILRRLDDARV